VLPLLDAGHDLPLGHGVAFQLVGDQHARRSPLLLQPLAEQSFGGLLVAPGLDQDIENKALLVNRAPEPMLVAGDGDDDLVEVPFIATTGCAPTDAIGEFSAEFQAPPPAVDLRRSSTVCDRDAASRQYLLDHTQAQREPGIQSGRVAHELGWVAIANIQRVSARRHPRQISGRPGSAKREAAQVDGTLLCS
jgi:hypothetical protein